MTDGIEKAEISQTGCWISSGAGWRGASEVIRIAWAHGMEKSEDDERIVDAFENNSGVILSDGTEVSVSSGNTPAEYIMDQGGMSDNAVNWLNDNVAPEGTFFTWNDGEFFLSCAIPAEEVNGNCSVCGMGADYHFDN